MTFVSWQIILLSTIVGGLAKTARKFIPVAVLALITLLLCGLPLQRAEADPGWWDTDWIYRKEITVNNSLASALTDYQVKIDVSYESAMQADFDDLRFTNASDAPLDYWLESKTDGVSATVWVEVDSIAASGDTTIYMYYGNGTASSASDGDATFDFFDDFEDGSQDWTIVEGSWSESTGILSVTRGTPPEDRVKRSFSDPGSNYAYEWKHRQYDLGGNGYPWAGLQIKSPTTDYSNYDQGYACYSYADGGTSVENQVKIFRCTNGGITQIGATVSVTINQNTWYDYKITYNGGTIKFYVNDIERISTSDATYTMGAVIRLQKNNDDCAVDYDDVRIRKYASPEPVISSFGPEETQPPRAVGGEVYPINKVALLMPWPGLVLVLILALGGGALVLIRRRTR